MPGMGQAAVENLSPGQATALSLLVELEARWENLRKAPSRAGEGRSGTQALLVIQKAYDAFHNNLVAYNRRYAPAHVPELLLNTPQRLGAWCRSMRQLYGRVAHDPLVPCPVHLLEKAYRLADHLGVRLNKGRAQRPAPAGTVGAALGELEAVGRWCDDLAGAERPAVPDTTAARVGT